MPDKVIFRKRKPLMQDVLASIPKGSKALCRVQVQLYDSERGGYVGAGATDSFDIDPRLVPAITGHIERALKELA